jgi:methyl-accepting chemotaxis protein
VKLNIQWKTSIAIFALIICVFSNFIGIQLWISSSRAHGTIINLAGRQRMLTQKMTKEVMFIASGLNVRDDVKATKQLFDRTLNGLINGDSKLGLPAAKTDGILAQLHKVDGLWGKFQSAIDGAANNGFASEEHKKGLYSMSLKILKEMNKGVKMMEVESLRAVDSLRNSALFTFLASLLVGGLAIYYLKKHIINSLKDTVAIANRLKTGELTMKFNIKSTDELGELQGALKGTVGELSGIVKEIMGVAGTVADSSDVVSSTATQINYSILEQARQIEQSAVATTEVSQTIVDVAKNASEASNAAKESVDIAGEGSSIVEQTVTSMTNIADTVSKSSQTIEELGESSKQIGDIINVINEIASQTNLLALNAAIEAARAGEQGRGFAVVADEVRKLAEKTSKATDEITGMIKKIQQEADQSVLSMDKSKEEAENGVNLAEQAKGSLGNIVKASERCLDMVQSIATATEEQSAAIDEVSANIEKVTSDFTVSRDAVSQIDESTTDLANISANLLRLMSWFKTDSQAIELAKKTGIQELKGDHKEHTASLPAGNKSPA